MKFTSSSKGISDMIASVLLVAFTVAAFGIIVTWGTNYISETTQDVSEKSDTELNCIYGSISVSDLSYCNDYLYGIIENTGMIDVKNLTLQIIYSNASSITYPLNTSDDSEFLSLIPGTLGSFNESCDSNYDKIHLYTLTCPDVKDDAEPADVSQC